jgi:hypothetical protein
VHHRCTQCVAVCALGAKTNEGLKMKDFPHEVLPPHKPGRARWLMEHLGARGGKWTTTENTPQWTVRFKAVKDAMLFTSSNHWKARTEVTAGRNRACHEHRSRSPQAHKRTAQRTLAPR